MQKFSDFKNTIEQEYNGILIEEANRMNLSDGNLSELLHSIDTISSTYIATIVEEFTSSDLEDALFTLPTDVNEFTGQELNLNGDKLTIDWDAESGVTKLQLNGDDIDVEERSYDIDSLIKSIINTVGPKASEPTPMNSDDPEIGKKLSILKNIIRPKLINIFANSDADKRRIYNALEAYIKSGEDEEYLTTELDQRAIIDFFLDILDVIVTNRNLASLVTKNAITSEYDPISESVLTEAKKKKKKTTSDEAIDIKLDMLLKLGLVDNKIYARAKKALTNKKSAGTVPYLRNLLFDILDKLISYIKKDPTLYNRIRINVMKEMKGILPTKKNVEEAKKSGYESAKSGAPADVPGEFATHYFTKEAWLEGYGSYDPTKDINSEEEMKTFKQFNESIKMTEISSITEVMGELESLGNSSFATPEEAFETIADIVSKLGVTFDVPNAIDIATEVTEFDVTLDDIEGDEATLSVFAGESLEDKVEGDLAIKFTLSKSDDGIMVVPEILVYFDEDEAVSLSDIEFEVDKDTDADDVEDEGMDLDDTVEPNMDDVEEELDQIEEEFVDGKTYNVILFKPATRRFFSVILQANSDSELEKIVETDYPEYTIHSVYPIKITDPIAD